MSSSRARSRWPSATAVIARPTWVAYSMRFDFSTPDDGRMDVDSTSAEVLADLLGVGDAALPPCTSMEILNVTIRDPYGFAFAVPGTATSP